MTSSETSTPPELQRALDAARAAGWQAGDEADALGLSRGERLARIERAYGDTMRAHGFSIDGSPLHPTSNGKPMPPRKSQGRRRASRAKGDVTSAVLGSWLADGTLAALTAREQTVLVAMVVRARPGTRSDPLRVRIGAGRLAALLGCDPSTVRRAVAGLVRRGLVEVVARGGSSVGPSVYAIRKPWQSGS